MAHKISETKKKNLDKINQAPVTHMELVKIAQKQLKGHPKSKFKMKVELLSGKVFCTLYASTSEKLKKSKATFSHHHPDKQFIYCEIEPVNKPVKHARKNKKRSNTKPS